MTNLRPLSLVLTLLMLQFPSPLAFAEVTDAETTDWDLPDNLPIPTPRPPKPINRKQPKTSRGLMQLPRRFCHTWSYNKPSSGQEDYLHPVTGCAFIAGLQAWYKEHCPRHRAGCTVRHGDKSHFKNKRFDGHSHHKHGHCIDIRPFTTDPHDDTATWLSDDNYSRNTTIKFLQHMRKFGADLPGRGESASYFNDKKARQMGLTQYAGGHHNHIHLCMEPGTTTGAACRNYEPDYNVCPEVAGIVDYVEEKGLR